MEWHIIGILVFIVIYNLYRYYHEDNDNDYSPVTTTTPESNHIEETCMQRYAFFGYLPNISPFILNFLIQSITNSNLFCIFALGSEKNRTKKHSLLFRVEPKSNNEDRKTDCSRCR